MVRVGFICMFALIRLFKVQKVAWRWIWTWKDDSIWWREKLLLGFYSQNGLLVITINGRCCFGMIVFFWGSRSAFDEAGKVEEEWQKHNINVQGKVVDVALSAFFLCCASFAIYVLCYPKGHFFWRQSEVGKGNGSRLHSQTRCILINPKKGVFVRRGIWINQWSSYVLYFCCCLRCCISR